MVFHQHSEGKCGEYKPRLRKQVAWNMNLLLTKCDQMTFQECPKCKQPIAGRAHDFENMLKEL